MNHAIMGQAVDWLANWEAATGRAILTRDGREVMFHLTAPSPDFHAKEAEGHRLLVTLRETAGLRRAVEAIVRASDNPKHRLADGVWRPVHAADWLRQFEDVGGFYAVRPDGRVTMGWHIESQNDGHLIAARGLYLQALSPTMMAAITDHIRSIHPVELVEG
jgi:hypothetical protein